MRLSPLVQLSLILTVYAGTADSATEKVRKKLFLLNIKSEIYSFMSVSE